MSYTYKSLGNDPAALGGKPIEYILRKEDGAFIPISEDNRDYQEYLKWVAEGNKIEDAD
tara:strand:- start:1757 stop:1933 length:177 start_codon:yes stop_codon:yes gene_type:complete